MSYGWFSSGGHATARLGRPSGREEEEEEEEEDDDDELAACEPMTTLYGSPLICHWHRRHRCLCLGICCSFLLGLGLCL
mgnify:CR=1 FL=1